MVLDQWALSYVGKTIVESDLSLLAYEKEDARKCLIVLSLYGILHYKQWMDLKNLSSHWFDSKSCISEHNQNNGNGCPEIILYLVYSDIPKSNEPRWLVIIKMVDTSSSTLLMLAI